MYDWPPKIVDALLCVCNNIMYIPHPFRRVHTSILNWYVGMVRNFFFWWHYANKYAWSESKYLSKWFSVQLDTAIAINAYKTQNTLSQTHTHLESWIMDEMKKNGNELSNIIILILKTLPPRICIPHTLRSVRPFNFGVMECKQMSQDGATWIFRLLNYNMDQF